MSSDKRGMVAMEYAFTGEFLRRHDFVTARDPAALRAEGCAVDDKVEESEYAKFGWVIDPENNKVELREPPPGR